MKEGEAHPTAWCPVVPQASELEMINKSVYGIPECSISSGNGMSLLKPQHHCIYIFCKTHSRVSLQVMARAAEFDKLNIRLHAYRTLV